MSSESAPGFWPQGYWDSSSDWDRRPTKKQIAEEIERMNKFRQSQRRVDIVETQEKIEVLDKIIMRLTSKLDNAQSARNRLIAQLQNIQTQPTSSGPFHHSSAPDPHSKTGHYPGLPPWLLNKK